MFVENRLTLLSQLLHGLKALATAPDYHALFRGACTYAANAGPWQLLGLFLLSSLIMVWRLNAVEQKGFEGTVIGTLVMPYCSGFGNLAFAYVMGTSGGDAAMVLENCIVNNVTNLTLLLGIPALLWGLTLGGNKEGRADRKLNYLSLLLTLIAMIFFTAVAWALGRDGVLNQGDGLVLIGLFLFWQVFQVFDLMKANVRSHRAVPPSIVLDLALVAAAAWGTYYSIEGLVAWISDRGGEGLLSYQQLGILSGLLMVVPNGILAFYYAAVNRSDIAYSSQIGDGHICIPMCIGIYAVFSPIKIPATFETGALTLMAVGAVHLVFIGVLKRLPRAAGALIAASYGFFFYKGILG